MEKEAELHPSPSKRSKTLAPSLAAAEKGKVKMGDDSEVVTGAATCGICLSDAGPRSARGLIDSCGHYFCFVCIMEWARVESRCPACKRRFSSIRRAPVPGLFPCARLVHVPVRDQVYHPLGNEPTWNSDPYENVNCSYCHSTRDEEHLLLCDLCDSAAHTYCVGLGATVPEGDWYCPDCTVSRDEHSKAQLDADYGDQSFHKKSSEVEVADSAVSIFEIVSGERTSNSSRRISDTRRSSRNATSQSSSQDPMLHLEQPSPPNLSTHGPISRENIIEQGARTLHHCRNLHERIRTLRENWNALRAGSIDFSSSLMSNGGTRHDREQRSQGMENHVPTPLQFVSSTKSEQMSAEVSTSTKIDSSKDVNRAWKMMKIAKSIQGSGGVMSDHSLSSPGKGNGSKVTKHIHTGSLGSRRQIPTHEVPAIIGSRKHCTNDTPESTDKKCKAKVSERQKPNKRTKLTFHQDGCHGQESTSAQKVLNRTSSDTQDAQASVDSAVFSCSGAWGPSFRKRATIVSSNSVIGPGAVGLDGSAAMKRNGIINDAKAEVQALVKLNLKLLNKDQHLGVDRFKEVARVATHTILAACGLEHSKSRARSFPSSICKHTEKVKQVHKSNLMPGSCRECFYTFVKDVVDSVVFDNNIFNPAHAG